MASPRSRQIKLAIVAVLIAVPVLFVLFWQAKDKRAVRQYKQHLLAAGEKLTIGELTPRPAFPENNTAPSLFKSYSRRPGSSILSTNEPRAMRLVAPGKAAVGWAQPSIIGERITNSWDEALDAYALEAPPPEWIDQIIASPVLDFRLDYSAGFDLLLPHLAPLKYTASHLCWGVIFDLHRHDPASAVAKARAILAEAYALRDERLIISQLVRISITHIGIVAVWELLQSPDVTGEQLAALQQDLARLDLATPYLDALQMERAMQQMLLERMRSSSAEFRRLTSGAMPGTPAAGTLLERAGNFALFKTRETAWSLAWSYPDELRALKGFQILIDGLRSAQAGLSYSEITNRTEAQLDALGVNKLSGEDISGLFGSGQMNIRNFLSSSVVSLRNGINRVEATEIVRSLAVTAIALQRYRLRHGQFPAGLSALTPEILPSVPLDPVDHKPLRYHLDPDATFLLYSIGPDGVDNGGDPKPATETKTYSWQKGRDWVWPQPATPEEVSAFYQKENGQNSFRARYGVPPPPKTATN